ncbi:MAG: formate dehydrogenase subunit alpha [Betaproteobacteria bacterium]|nr:MAG: formate dehydrogenase subunit alpha [Betaproteobacteria bacterium]
MVRFDLDGAPVEAREGESILEAARRHGASIPTLCHKHGYRADGNCRACVVEIEGERVLAPSCCRHPSRDMKVRTTTERVRRAQKMVLELLLADVPADHASAPYRHDSELATWARALGVSGGRFVPRDPPPADVSHPAIAVNLDACIQCGRCVRACREEQGNDVIGMAFRGAHAQIVFDTGEALGSSTCVACGECVQACPTGALAPAADVARQAPERSVDSLCPFCGVGCQVTYRIRDDRIVWTDGRDGPANASRLCVKGRYGFDYAFHAERLTRPLVRRDGAAKTAELLPPASLGEVFREASWEEALDLAAGGLRRLREAYSSTALAGFGSAKCSNEEAYLFQKLVRIGFGNNNVDHCTRLCHASSVAALLEGIGSAAVSNPVRDVEHADFILVIGANPTENHPVAATWIKNAARRGATLVVADPRRNDLMRHASIPLCFRADTDIALLQALLHVIIDEGLVNEPFVRERVREFEALKAGVAGATPEAMAPVCGIDAATLRDVARRYATAKAAMILWGMGISQHTHGTDNARCLIALALVTGQIGRPGTGLHPLRGQNNVQGASDAGLIPMFLPDYRPAADAEARAAFADRWGAPLNATRGLTVVEITHAIHAGTIRGMYIVGENPAMSDPDARHVRAALASLEHLVVQDIFPTETAGFADVILPATSFFEKTGSFTNTDRTVQLARRALDPPGDARADLWIVVEMARRMGLDWRYEGPEAGVAAVHEEMRLLMPSMQGITWERLEREGAVTYPCHDADDPGEPIVFRSAFPTADGRGRLVAVTRSAAAEPVDREFPLVLITGRELEHWHTGAMTRRATVLDALEPEPTASLHPRELARLGAVAGAPVTVETRRGAITLSAREDSRMPEGAVFVPFCFVEAAANLLTHSALDPVGKIPGFKYCAARVRAA